MSLINNEGDNKHKGGGIRKIYEQARPLLHLTADQENTINEALSSLKQERQDAKNNESDDGQLRTARQAAKQQILEVLSPDQKKLWHETAQQLRQDN